MDGKEAMFTGTQVEPKHRNKDLGGFWPSAKHINHEQKGEVGVKARRRDGGFQ